MPLVSLILLGLVTFVIIFAFRVFNTLRQSRLGILKYLDALKNTEVTSSIPSNPLERKLINEQYIVSAYGFPVDVLSDILLLADNTSINALVLETQLKRLPAYKRDCGNGIYRRSVVKMDEYRLVIISGEISIDIILTRQQELLTIDPISPDDLALLTTLYLLWINHDFSRLGILGFFKNIYTDRPFRFLKGSNVGLSDYTGGRDLGACWWILKDTNNGVYTYEISYMSNHYTIVLSEDNQQYMINHDIVNTKTFKRHIKEIING